jgi:hypothetical protein
MVIAVFSERQVAVGLFRPAVAPKRPGGSIKLIGDDDSSATLLCRAFQLPR